MNWPSPSEVRLKAANPFQAVPVNWTVVDPHLRKLGRGQVDGFCAATGISKSLVRRRLRTLGIKLPAGRRTVVERASARAGERVCAHCLLPLKTGGAFTMHPACEREIAAKAEAKAERRRRQEAIKAVPATPPESSQIAGNGPPCDFCGWVHGNGPEAVACRARFERANRDLADLRKRRVQ